MENQYGMGLWEKRDSSTRVKENAFILFWESNVSSSRGGGGSKYHHQIAAAKPFHFLSFSETSNGIPLQKHTHVKQFHWSADEREEVEVILVVVVEQRAKCLTSSPPLSLCVYVCVKWCMILQMSIIVKDHRSSLSLWSLCSLCVGS